MNWSLPVAGVGPFGLVADLILTTGNRDHAVEGSAPGGRQIADVRSVPRLVAVARGTTRIRHTARVTRYLEVDQPDYWPLIGTAAALIPTVRH